MENNGMRCGKQKKTRGWRGVGTVCNVSDLCMCMSAEEGREV